MDHTSLLADLVAHLRRGLPPPPAPDSSLLVALEALARGGPLPDPRWRAVLAPRRSGDKQVRAAAAGLLVQLGRWDGHDDLEALKLVRPRHFSPEALAEIDSEPALDLPRDEAPFVSIDGPDPLEIDDALWAGPIGKEIEVAIAIASPGRFFAAGGALDKGVSRRAATLYHPRHTVPMLPEALGALASLEAGRPRPALVARMRIDREGHRRGVELRHALVTVRRAWTYQAVDDRLAGRGKAPGEPMLAALWEAAQRSEARRRAAGAYLLYRVAAEVSCPPFAEPRVRIADQATPARRVVGEMMVLYGEAVAARARERGAAVPFRSQEPPKAPPLPPGLYTDAADIRSMIRHMAPARFALTAGRHATLGVDAYVQATSPLRRFLDLLTQRQLLALLAGRPPPYGAADVERAIARCRRTTTAYRRAQRRADRYFTLLHLVRRGPGSRLLGQIVPDIARQGRCMAFVPELALDLELEDYAGSVGDWVRVEVAEVDVGAGTVRACVLAEVQR